MKRRCGMTLIELLAVIGASTVVLGLVGGTIQTLARGQRSVEQQLREVEQLNQLSSSFRRHAHAAMDAQCSDDGKEMELVPSANRKITLSSRESGLEESESLDGRVVRRQTYRMAAGSVVRFETAVDAGRARASLVVRRTLDSRLDGAERTLRIEAIVGRDHAPAAGDGVNQ
jgi:type II secretory pathway pseudopilin PulG